ncbi:MAG: ATP-binding protein [Verrucomicrobiae bacterium]|nr:ATP-binding protein [Verrucomicrobiae bacterium]
MKRFAEQYLSEWRNRSDRKPLVVRGARQVGKTHLVEHWGQGHFKVVVKLDLERERDLHALFEGQDPRKLLEEISLLKGQRLVPGECLLFLDEVQACPRALSALRYFHEIIPEVHVVAAGSLLDFALREFKHSMPVGRIEYLFLHPMSFEEFLLATEGEPLVTHLQNFHLGDEVNAAVATRIKESLRRYFFIGGMPEAVHASTEKAGLVDIQRIQSSIVQTMQDDFAKYGTRLQQDLLRKAFRHVAQHVGRKIKYVNISRESRSAEVKTALGLLAQSRVVHLVLHTSANGIPLGAETNERHFKGLFLDIGLANQLCGLNLAPIEELLTVNEGGLAEQFVGQELLCSGLRFQEEPLFYWHREARNANAEVDYVISEGRSILPVEVKAAKGGALRSVFQFLQEKRQAKAIRFYAGKTGIETLAVPGESGSGIKLLSLPLFLAGQTHRLAREFCRG